MIHPVVLQRLADDRHDQYEREARHDARVRASRMSIHQDPPTRFRVRDLRWILFRPTGA